MPLVSPPCVRRSFSTRSHRRPVIGGLAPILSLVVLLAAGTAVATPRYEKAVNGKALVAGLGFEGVLTVFDETPRMFTSLGQPRQRPEYKLWYFYEGGKIDLVVRAEFHDGRFLVRSMRASGRPGALRTARGITLGQPASRAVAVYGEPDEQKPGRLTYHSRGIAFLLGKTGAIIGIEVSRPSLGGAPDPREEKPPVRTPDPVPAAPAVPTITDLGLSIPTPDSWVQAGEPTLELQELMGDGGAVRVRVEVCRDCSERLGEQIKHFESARTPNVIPRAVRDVDRRWLEAIGADAGYLGRYAEGDVIEWLLALRRGRRAWMVSIQLDTSRPLSQAILSDVARALAGVRLPPSE